MTYTIVALYKFVPVADVAAAVAALKPRLAELGICGTILIAPEGINGTLAGTASGVDGLLAELAARFGLSREADHVKFSYAETKPFKRLKVRPKKEIITFKQEGADPNKQVGQYVEPKDWNALISDPDVLVLDTRNDYETMIGTYDNAVVPPIKVFTEFAQFVREKLDPKKHQKVAMFCTGGIRCEKASAFMLSEGFPEVYHLKGGILKYLEDVPAEQSKWQGDCYVFDRRVAVSHGLKPAALGMCFCCGFPLRPEDREHPHFEEGVSCRHCHANTNDEQKARFRMRQEQGVEI
ncbi:MAG: rhodanese-related sulfurtransferase [Alphaproteobacteria bacterium]|nr:rhodanese-related sulfurtransferase [Alphaproteobacteria bacterium]